MARVLTLLLAVAGAAAQVERHALFAGLPLEQKGQPYSAFAQVQKRKDGRLLPDVLERMTPGLKETLYRAFCRRYRGGDDRCSEGRLPHFEACLGRIARGNAALLAEGKGTVLGITSMCDRSEEELGALLPPEIELQTGRTDHRPPVDLSGVGVRTIDWREKPVAGVEAGAVPPVRDQGTCGASWAFAAVALMDGYTAIAHGVLPNMSPAELASCTHTDASGCMGGWQHAFAGREFLGDFKDCYQEAALAAGHISSVERLDNVPFPDVAYLNRAIQLAPFMTVFTVTDDWLYYVGGVMDTDFCDRRGSKRLGAQVALTVGYVSDGDYFIFQMPWGESWGEQGYFRARIGACGSTSASGKARAFGVISQLTYEQEDYIPDQDEVVQPTGPKKSALFPRLAVRIGGFAAA